MDMERRKSGENVAVTVEATISLTAFMFAIIRRLLLEQLKHKKIKNMRKKIKEKQQFDNI